MTVIGNSFMYDDAVQDPRRVEVVFLCGSAAVGKTSVMLELAKVSSREIRVHTVGSTTRNTYKRLGIDTEKAATHLDSDKQQYLQVNIFEDYLTNLRSKVEEACLEATRDAYSHRVHIVAVDRSPFDHVTYAMLGQLNASLTSVLYSIEEADKLISDLDGLHSYFGVKTQVNFSYALFEYPAHWMFNAKHDVHDDGFRVNMSARNYAWSLALKSLIMERVSLEVGPWYITFDSKNSLSPKLRAQEIINLVTNGNG